MDSDEQVLVSAGSDHRNYQSIDDVISDSQNSGPGWKRPQYIAAVTASLCALSTGVTLGWTSPIQTALEHGEFNNIAMNENQVGWVGSLLNVGAFLACIPTGYICDAIGRKTTIMLLLIPFSVGWLLIMLATNVAMIYSGRIITGLAAGASCVAVPMYMSEIAHKAIRGNIGTYFQLMVTIGVLYAYIFGAIFSPMIYTIVCAFSIIAYAMLFVFQPESPLYHLMYGRLGEARFNLQKLRGDEYEIGNEMMDMLEGLNEERLSFRETLRELRKKACWRSLSLAIMLMWFQQFSGINVIVFYTSDIFIHADIKIDPRYCSILVGVAQVIATFLSSLVIDRLGRRKLLLWSALIMAFAMMSLGTCFYIKQHKLLPIESINLISWLTIVFVFVYIIAYSFGLGPIPWVLCGELFSVLIKGFACSLAGMFNWQMSFVITKSYLSISNRIGEHNSLFVFGLVLLYTALYVYNYLPETKGKTNSEIQEELENRD